MQTAIFEYADGAILEFGTRGELTNDEGGVSGSATCSTARRAGCGSRNQARCGSRTWDRGAKNEKGPGADAPRPPKPTGLTTTEFPHYQNFIDAIRANDPKLLTCDVMEGHLSSTLPHLGNISYRVGHGLMFNGKTETFETTRQPTSC